MNSTHQVRFWEIKTLRPDTNGRQRKRPHGVRWVTAGREHSEWFTTKALAKAHLGKLVQAANRGEAFDMVTGLPESLYRLEHSPGLLRVAQEFLAHVWDDMAPNSRSRLVDGLAVAVQGFCDAECDADPVEVRRALTTVILPPVGGLAATADQLAIRRWFEEHSRNVADLVDDQERTAFGRRLASNLDGSKARPTTVDTRKGAVVQALSFAVDRSYLGTNPLRGLRLSRYQAEVAIDPGVVVSPVQARSLLAAVTYARPRGTNPSWLPFFATLYFAGVRPSEARFLGVDHCELPRQGWGELVLPRSLGKAAARYTDDGRTYQERPLKHRAERTTRRVPIPPELVRLLAEHIEREGTAADGRLFRNSVGGPVASASYSDVWRLARPLGLAPRHVASSLARRPYDLRHAAVSSWIAAGVQLPEVARRAGHTVQVLLAVYAKVIHGSTDAMNQQIEAFLSGEHA